jgi:hypothetical protein
MRFDDIRGVAAPMMNGYRETQAMVGLKSLRFLASPSEQSALEVFFCRSHFLLCRCQDLLRPLP